MKAKPTARIHPRSLESITPAPFIEVLENRIAPAFTASLTGLVGTLVGDGAGDTLTIVNSADLLVHNRFTAGDPGFASDSDWDTTQAGTQTLAAGGASSMVILLGAGDDTVSFSTNTGPARIEGGPGNDAISGTSSADIILGGTGNDDIRGQLGIDQIFGGPGNDSIQGGDGDDVIHGGDGDDRIVWNPGDDDDTIDGDAGLDTLEFNNANVGETVDFFALNGRLQVFRNIASVTLNLGTVEAVEQNTLGQPDTINVQNVASTDLQSIFIHLGTPLGSTGGDGQTDTINVFGTDFADDIRVRPDGQTLEISGLPVLVRINGAEPADTLNIRSSGGFDNVQIAPSSFALMTITQDGEVANPALPGYDFSTAVSFDTGLSPSAVAVGHLFGPGRDVVTTNTKGNSITVLLQGENGAFLSAEDFATGGKAPRSVALGDFNGDLLLDIAVTNSGSGNISIFLNDGLGSFSAPTLFSTGNKPGKLVATDLNGDGNLDLVTIIAGNRLAILAGDGAGLFGAPSTLGTGGKKPVDFVIEDFSGDGHGDIAIAHAATPQISILVAQPDFTFAAPLRFRVGLGPSALAVGDFNADGRTDLAVSHSVSRFASVLLNASSGGAVVFQPQIKLTNPGKNGPLAIAVGDLDGNGRDDLVVGNTAAGTISAFFSLDTGAFRQPVRIDLDNTPPRKSGGLRLADLNEDGYLDIITSNAGTHDLSVVFTVRT